MDLVRHSSLLNVDEFFREFPSILVLGTLVAIFIALYRQERSIRVRYWLIGWSFVLVRFFLPIFNIKSEIAANVAAAGESGALQLGGIAFLFSVMQTGKNRWLQRIAILQVVFVSLGYILMASLDVEDRWPYVLCLAVVFFGGAAWHMARCAKRPLAFVGAASLVGLGCASIHYVLHGDIIIGWNLLMAATYLGAALLFWAAYKRRTPGLIVTCAGLACWSWIWLVPAFSPQLVISLGARNDIWNVPKYVVAFGMICLILEKQSLAAKNASERERSLNLQLRRFAEATSNLLSGMNIDEYFARIADIYAETTSFHQVAILLTGERKHLYIAGQQGLSPSHEKWLGANLFRLTADTIAELCLKGQPVGRGTVLCPGDELRKCISHSNNGTKSENLEILPDALLVPLRAPRGAFLGVIALVCSADQRQPDLDEISRIEMLAADVAVAVENVSLQRQLVLTEKLAGIGQLVSGVAHELNNPLTSVLGFSDMLVEETREVGTRHSASVIHREAKRMKGIIENLLRFAQQDQADLDLVNLEDVLRSVLTLRSYEAQIRGIEVQTDIERDLPPVKGDQAQLKQVFLHIFNNALDALHEAPDRLIRVEARSQDKRIVLRFFDSGPGFVDVHRVFDPFFTTKAPGKGTGLGLSICYGILKQHGGSIKVTNAEPCGASVMIELPVADSTPVVTI